jgi:hypothetical protein
MQLGVDRELFEFRILQCVARARQLTLDLVQPGVNREFFEFRILEKRGAAPADSHEQFRAVSGFALATETLKVLQCARPL